MPNSNSHQERTLDLSREAQWVIHHVMLDRMEAEARNDPDEELPPLAVYQVFDKIEAGTDRFSWRERRCLTDELQTYLDDPDTPDRDEPVVERILGQLRRTDSAVTVSESTT